MAACEKFVDDHDGLRGLDIAVFQEASFDESCSHGPKISRSDLAVERIVPLARFGRRRAFDDVALCVPLGGEWRIRSESSADNSGLRPQFREHVVIEASDFRVRVVPGWRQTQYGDKQVIGAEAQIHLMKIPQRLNHKSGTDQQSESKGKLPDD